MKDSGSIPSPATLNQPYIMKLKRKLYSEYRPFIPKNYIDPNLIPSKLNKEAEKYNYLVKLGRRQIIGPGSKELNPRFGKTAKVGDIILGAGKFAYKKGKRLK